MLAKRARLHLPIVVLTAGLLACNSTADDSNDTNGQTCTSTVGTIEGDIYYWGLPGEPNSMPAANALVALRKTKQDMPILGNSDESGHFSIDLAAGSWLVGAQDGGGCVSEKEQTITLAACELEKLVLVLDLCAG